VQLHEIAGGYDEFPEYGLWSRYERAYEWTPDDLDRLLDAGCAWGYGTRFFDAKARDVVGLDPGATAIAVARKRYPALTFVESALESTPFESDSFDAIVCCDVFEHVSGERECLDEMWRILRPGGVVTMTVPHRGPLGILDPDNYGRKLVGWAKRQLPWLYRWYLRTFSSQREFAAPAPGASAGADEFHRHYTLSDLRGLLDDTEFRSGYEVRRVARTGFVLEALLVNLHFFLRRFVRGRGKDVIDAVVGRLLALDYRIPYGRLANNLAIQFAKTPGD
jgi:ubiquinone/menaquinone biosynthesis C-methylase UbiE